MDRDNAVVRLRRFLYRLSQEVLNSNVSVKQEIESILIDPAKDRLFLP